MTATTKFFDPKKYLEESKAKKQMNEAGASIFLNPFPSTILQTSNFAQVKETCRGLLSECTTFTDPDFKPVSESLFNSYDKVPTLPKIEWRRPNEISLNSDLIGFYESKIEPKKLPSLQGSDNILGGRINQSAYLDNRWFLNALSIYDSV